MQKVRMNKLAMSDYEKRALICHYVNANLQGMSPLKIGVKGDIPLCAFKSLCVAFGSIVCIMQINSSWYYTLGKEWWSTLGDPCSNIRGGALILSTCMKKYGYTWEAVGCYNSQTPGKRDRYALAVSRQLKNIQKDAAIATNIESR